MTKEQLEDLVKELTMAIDQVAGVVNLLRGWRSKPGLSDAENEFFDSIETPVCNTQDKLTDVLNVVWEAKNKV